MIVYHILLDWIYFVCDKPCTMGPVNSDVRGNNSVNSSLKRKLNSECHASTISSKRISFARHAPTRQILTSDSFERTYKKFLKEYNIKQISQNGKVTPNLLPSRSPVQKSPKTDKNGWTIPRKTAKGELSKHSNTETSIDEIPRSKINFDDLLNESDDSLTIQEDNIIINQKMKIKDRVYTVNSNNNTQMRRPPPIHAKNTSLRIIIDLLLSKNILKEDFQVKQAFDPGNVTVFTPKIETFESTKKILLDNNLEYYTYTPRNTKPKSVILKGIKGGFTETDIRNEIEQLNISNVKLIKISKIVFDKYNNNNYHFLIQVTNDSQIKNLTKIEVLA